MSGNFIHQLKWNDLKHTITTQSVQNQSLEYIFLHLITTTIVHVNKHSAFTTHVTHCTISFFNSDFITIITSTKNLTDSNNAQEQKILWQMAFNTENIPLFLFCSCSNSLTEHWCVSLEIIITQNFRDQLRNWENYLTILWLLPSHKMCQFSLLNEQASYLKPYVYDHTHFKCLKSAGYDAKLPQVVYKLTLDGTHWVHTMQMFEQ